MTDSCKEWSRPEPFYRIRTNEVMIGFNTESGIVENIVDGIAEKNDLSEIQKNILKLMQANPKISAKTIANEVGIAPRNVQTHIQSLKATGKVERHGSAKGGRWVVSL